MSLVNRDMNHNIGGWQSHKVHTRQQVITCLSRHDNMTRHYPQYGPTLQTTIRP
ncbi:hypothetical protein BDR04DRAFT_1090797 [Suillus decipiens]|nr:hypothetical protein BDR04DRAFT_1090797 [Suillus decipiens]